MADSSELRKEVLPPQKQSSGLGVMVVAATAMFFAVASSAFILRARMAQSCCPARAMPAPIVIETTPATPSDDCGAAVVREHPDGSSTWYWEPCDEPIPVIVGEQPPAAVEGIVVDKVHLPKN